MLNKFKSKKGFTLMEMLIVVAIIAVLVAIAIPTFTSSMNKAKAGVDLANIRSGYANAQIIAMTDNVTGVYYLKEDGTVDDGSGSGSGYYKTQSTSANADSSAKVGGVFQVSWTADKFIKYTLSDGKVTAIEESASLS